MFHKYLHSTVTTTAAAIIVT